MFSRGHKGALCKAYCKAEMKFIMVDLLRIRVVCLVWLVPLYHKIRCFSVA